jgi:hypothetical protein
LASTASRDRAAPGRCPLGLEARVLRRARPTVPKTHCEIDPAVRVQGRIETAVEG